MKKLLFFICLLIAVPAHGADGDRWCAWSGSVGTACVNERNGKVKLPTGLYVSVDDPANVNHHDFYSLTVTEPTIPEGSMKDAEVWGKIDNDISLTWTVRTKTTDEVNTTVGNTMSEEMYHILKWFDAEGYIVPSTAPQGIKDAYLARQALGQ